MGGAVLCVEFDPSGAPKLAVGSADRRAVVYDVRALSRGAVALMDGRPRGDVRAVGRCRGGAARRVGTSAEDVTHRLWEWGQLLAAQIEGHQIGGWGEKFGKTTKMAAHLLPLLEIKFFHLPSKYGDRSLI